MDKEEKRSRIKRISNSDTVKLIMQFRDGLRQDNINSYASSCAFFIFLSLVPVLIVVCAILPYTPLKQSDVVDILTKIIPDYMSGMIVSVVDEVYDKSIGLLSIAIITALWSAGKGVNALIVGLNAMQHEDPKKNNMITRLFASLYTLIFLASVIIFLTLVVFGKNALGFLRANYPQAADFFNTFVRMRNVISILLMTAVFMVLYAELPSRKMRIRDQLVGAVFTSLSWTLFSLLFSLYVRNTDAFSIYGSFTTIIVMLIWLYFCMYLVFFGANLNKYLRPITIVIREHIFGKRRKKDCEEENGNGKD